MSSTTPVPVPSSVSGNLLVASASPSTGLATGSSGGVSQAVAAGLELVYIVENDYISAVITELIIKKNLFGSEVRCYANGQWAFDELMLALREGGALPDLIVLDLDMPLMDGWEFWTP